LFESWVWVLTRFLVVRRNTNGKAAGSLYAPEGWGARSSGGLWERGGSGYKADSKKQMGKRGGRAVGALRGLGAAAGN